jgi:predicted secreted protein
MLKKLLTTVLLSTALCGTVVAMTQDVTKETHKPIVVSSSHHEFTVMLHSNPSTGYEWFLVNGEELHGSIEPVSRKIVHLKHPKGFVGAPVLEKWEFVASEQATRVPQMFELKFAYARAWELNKEPSETKTILVVTVPSN